MASKKQGNFLECCIVPDIAAHSEPPTQRDRFGIRRDDDGDSHLAGMPIVRSKEGDGTDRIAAKTLLSLSSHFRGGQPSFIETPRRPSTVS
jgi:hypothetical protein